jgi:hypothetical protein
MEIVHARVRGRAVGKGLVRASTSLAAYPTAEHARRRCRTWLPYGSPTMDKAKLLEPQSQSGACTHPSEERLKTMSHAVLA